jgi:hypothetical protein
MIGATGSQGGPTNRRQDLLTFRESRLWSAALGKDCGDADLPRRRHLNPMPQPLAHAFLALADDPETVDQRTLPRMFAAAAATLVLAVGAPLGFLVINPDDHAIGPLAGSKFSFTLDDD